MVSGRVYSKNQLYSQTQPYFFKYMDLKLQFGYLRSLDYAATKRNTNVANPSTPVTPNKASF